MRYTVHWSGKPINAHYRYWFFLQALRFAAFVAEHSKGGLRYPASSRIGATADMGCCGLKCLAVYIRLPVLQRPPSVVNQRFA